MDGWGNDLGSDGVHSVHCGRLVVGSAGRVLMWTILLIAFGVFVVIFAVGAAVACVFREFTDWMLGL